jgi:hypothetical protein
MSERNKKLKTASVLVGRPADKGVGFKRNKVLMLRCDFCKKEKRRVIKRGEIDRGRAHQETRSLILRGLHEHEKKRWKKNKERRKKHAER